MYVGGHTPGLAVLQRSRHTCIHDKATAELSVRVLVLLSAISRAWSKSYSQHVLVSVCLWTILFTETEGACINPILAFPASYFWGTAGRDAFNSAQSHKELTVFCVWVLPFLIMEV